MFRHVVLYTYKSTLSESDIAKIYEELDEISSQLPGRLSYTWGKYNSHEGRNKNYTHCLVADFIDEKSRNIFLEDHKRLELSKQKVIPNMINGVDGIVSFDFIC
jgi:hypothetical protein